MKEAKVIYEKWINGEKVLSEENTVAEMTDCQKSFLAKGTGQKLFTETEVNAQMDGIIKSFEVAAMDYIMKEREACAKLAHDMEKERTGNTDDKFVSDIAKAILFRGQKAQTVDNA